jgi:hypothetical protein
MAGTDDDDSTFPLLRDEWALFLGAAGRSEKLAIKLVEQYLGKGERDRDGRIRYKIWMYEAFPGGMTPSPYDGEFWHSYPERGVCCTIEPWHSSAHWTGPVSASWKEFDGRQTADYQVFGIRPNHEIVVAFLQDIGMLPEQPSAKQESPSPLAPEAPCPPSSVAVQVSHGEAPAAPGWDPQADWTVETVMLNLGIRGWKQKAIIEAVSELPKQLKRYRTKSIPTILDHSSAADLHRAVEEVGKRGSPDSCEKFLKAWKTWRAKAMRP